MIILPEYIWNLLLHEIKRPRRKVERVAYLDGIALSEDLTVATTVAFPNAILQKQNYQVSPLAMSQAGAHLRAHGMLRLAQVHTHPGLNVDHSPTDDRLAYSQHIGSVSIVIPRHARRRPLISSCGIHVRDSRGWQRVPASEIPQLIRFVPTILDFRSKRHATHFTKT